MVEVRQIRNKMFAVANYLISDSTADYCYLVDVGDIGHIKDVAGGRTIKGVFLTHSHHDHMFGINDLMDEYPDCRVFVSEAGIPLLASDKLNFSRYTGPIVTYSRDNITGFSDEEMLEIYPGEKMMVIPTPGHSPDSMVYRIGDFLFTGDAYIPETPVVTKLRGGNKEMAKQSLEKIKEMINEETVVCPGHWGRGTLKFLNQ